MSECLLNVLTCIAGVLLAIVVFCAFREDELEVPEE